MNAAATTVLLVEDDPADARLIQAALADSAGGPTGSRPFRVEWVTRLSDALERLNREAIEVVLLDLSLPDGQGIEAFDQVLQAASHALILVLFAAGADEDEAARQAVQRGAHDTLAKGHVDAHWLPRALGYAIDRKAGQDALRNSEARFRAMSDASPWGSSFPIPRGAVSIPTPRITRYPGGASPRRWAPTGAWRSTRRIASESLPSGARRCGGRYPSSRRPAFCGRTGASYGHA